VYICQINLMTNKNFVYIYMLSRFLRNLWSLKKTEHRFGISDQNAYKKTYF
jgi:hypothetical protein